MISVCRSLLSSYHSPKSKTRDLTMTKFCSISSYTLNTNILRLTHSYSCYSSLFRQVAYSSSLYSHVNTSVSSNISLDITHYNMVKVNRRFGGIYHLHLQGRRRTEQRKATLIKHKSKLSSCLVIFRPWRWKQYGRITFRLISEN
jgi:hypothetical protein